MKRTSGRIAAATQKANAFPRIRIAALSKFRVTRSKRKALATPAKPLVCDFCNQTFATKSSWVRHTRTHIKQETNCVHCNMTFRDQSTLMKHLQVHTYTCTRCRKPFITVSEKPNASTCERCTKVLNPPPKPVKIEQQRSTSTVATSIPSPLQCPLPQSIMKIALQRLPQKPVAAAKNSSLKPVPSTPEYPAEPIVTITEQHQCICCKKVFKSVFALGAHKRSHKFGSRKKQRKSVPKSSGPATSTPAVPIACSTSPDESRMKLLNGLLSNYCGKASNSYDISQMNIDIEDDLKSRVNSRITKFMNKYSINNIPKKLSAGFPPGTPASARSVGLSTPETEETMKIRFKESLNLQFKMLINRANVGAQAKDDVQLKNHIRDKLKKLLGVHLAQN